ncbi:terminase [Escherichia coli]|uniref:Terminase n=1 Tax=Escherichia coli TaxID=562 RepID=A0A828PBL4_ECOLX|nr:terminase [Escherichia coli]EER6665899.1 terminase [Escherichia coli]EET7765698.1 terminase [Escherichia coli]EEV6494215.1 terminase [Escherichia coli]EEY2486713.1 terminase [Escherichia coli]EEY6243671.1 terminase [Escherichia coli]
MAKLDWKKLEQAFRREHARTGIKLQDWCRQNNISYGTARRYIKLRKNLPRNSEESAQKNAQKSAQIDDQKSAQKNAHESDGEASYDEASGDDGSDEQCAKNCANSAKTKRNSRSGNPHPVARFSDRNTHAVRHRGYAKYLEADNLMDDASDMVLFDELVFTRARALSVTGTLKKMFADLKEAADVETRVALYDKILKAEQALDRNIARIESIERSLLTLDVLAETAPKLRADRERINAARDKLRAETDILTSQRRGVVTPVSDIVSSLHEMSNSGRLDDIPEE